MADLVVSDVVWKKGERGIQKFFIYDSDGKTPHSLTGHNYTFKFWKNGESTLKGSGNLSIISAPGGEADYSVQAGDTGGDLKTTEFYVGEIIENDTLLKTDTFKVTVEKSAPA